MNYRTSSNAIRRFGDVVPSSATTTASRSTTRGSVQLCPFTARTGSEQSPVGGDWTDATVGLEYRSPHRAPKTSDLPDFDRRLTWSCSPAQGTSAEKPQQLTCSAGVESNRSEAATKPLNH